MKKTLLYIFIAISTLPLTLRAADTYTLLEPLPCIEGTGTNCTSGNTVKDISLDGYIGYIFKFSIALAAFLAVIMIIWGGFEYMLSETPFGKSSGKDRVTNALIGLLGILASYLILATIDPRLVEISTDIPKIEFRNSQSVVDFQRQLGEDLTKLTVNAQLENQQLQSKIISNEAALKGFKDKEESVGLEADEKVEYEKLKVETNDLRAAQTKVIAHGVMDNQFKVALDSIQGSQQKIVFTPGGLIDREATLVVRQKTLEDALKTIEKAYTDYGPQLTAANDTEGEKDLLLRKAYYKDEIEQEKKFSDVIINYAGYGVGTLKLMQDMKTSFEKEVAEAQNPLNQDEASGLVRNQDLENLHITVLQGRITTLDTVIKSKK